MYPASSCPATQSESNLTISVPQSTTAFNDQLPSFLALNNTNTCGSLSLPWDVALDCQCESELFCYCNWSFMYKITYDNNVV